MESKRVLCSSCDIYCQVQVDVDDGRVVRVKALDPRPLRSNICMKGVHAPSGFAHPDRVLHPLKRAGERGEGRWQRVTWDEALDEIAERLRAVVDRHGPESLAVATSQWNTQTENGAGRSCTASTRTSSRRASSSSTRRSPPRRRRSSSGRTPTPPSPTGGWRGSGSSPGGCGGTSTRTSSPAATWPIRPRRSGPWRPAIRTPSRRSSPLATTP